MGVGGDLHLHRVVPPGLLEGEGYDPGPGEDNVEPDCLNQIVSKEKSRFVNAVLILHRLFFVIIIVVFDKRFVEKNIVVAIFKKNFCCRQK